MELLVSPSYTTGLQRVYYMTLTQGLFLSAI